MFRQIQFLAVGLAVGTAGLTLAAPQQIERAGQGGMVLRGVHFVQGALPMPQEAEAQTEDGSETPAPVETIDNSQPGNPREIRLHLWDGNVITGELGIDEVSIQTEFGPLRVPVEKILSMRPGLDSFPQLREQIDKLVADLGADDYQTRENAHKALSAMGMQLRREIYRYQDDGNAERKRHLDEIRKEIENMAEEIEDDPEFDLEADAELIANDTIVTKDFTIVGKIAQNEFEISSKYGPLSVKLLDVRFADRKGTGNVERRTTVSVGGKNYAQVSPKSTGIQLNRGDRVSIRADGQITMSPWGNQAVVGPDGNIQYGNFNGHGGGTLLAQIGDDATFIKIGSKATFVASRAGTLKLGVAVQADYANDNYQYPGTYKAKIVVESSQPAVE